MGFCQGLGNGRGLLDVEFVHLLLIEDAYEASALAEIDRCGAYEGWRTEHVAAVGRRGGSVYRR